MGEEEVIQEFTASVEPYIAAIEDAVREARSFAEANLEASAAVKEMRDSAAETAVAGHELGAEAKDARDALLEEAAAARIAADETKKLRDAELEAAAAAGAEAGAAGLAGAVTSASESLSIMGPEAIAVAVALAAIAAIALTPFITGLAVATAGIGLFAAVAVPEISKVWTAVSQGGKALKALDPAERQLVGPIRSLRAEFEHLQKAVQPEILKAFAEGLKIIKDLMPALRPLIVAAGQALDGFLKSIDRWLNSPGGQKFIHWLSVEGPMAMKTFGHDLWVVANDVGDVFHFLYDTGETFDKNWKLFWHNCALVVDGFRIGFTQMGHLIESIWNQTIGFIIVTRGAVLLAWFQALPGRIRGFLESLPQLLFGIGWNSIMGLLHGIESAAGSLLSYVGHLASDVSGIFSKVLGIFSPSRVFHQHGVMLMAGLAEGIAAGAPMARDAIAAAGHLAGPQLGGYGTPALAGAGAAGAAGAAAGGVVVNVGGVTVHGWVGSDQQLALKVQDALLEHGTINPTTGIWPLTKGRIR